MIRTGAFTICSKKLFKIRFFTNMTTPKVLSIQSHTVHGYVGNKAATFPLQTCGMNVDCINTITLSNEPSYTGGFKGQTMSGGELNALVEGLDNNHLLNHDLILTGYTRTAELIDQIENTVKMTKKNNPTLMYVCDPVLGDDGKYYVPQELCEKYRQQILPLVTVITPNLFEAQQLSGVAIKCLSDAVSVCKSLLNLGPQIVILTGVKLASVIDTPGTSSSEDASPVCTGTVSDAHHPQLTVLLAYRTLSGITGSALSNVVSTADDIHIYRLDFPWIKHSFSGCGDLFSALLSAGLIRCRKHLSTAPHLLAGVLEVVTHAMSLVLTRTREGVVDGNQASEELRIVESADVFRAAADEFDSLVKGVTPVASVSENGVPRSLLHPETAVQLSHSLFASASSSHVAVSSRISGIIFDMDGTLTEAGAIDFDAMYTRTGLTRSRSADILALISDLPSEEDRERAMNVVSEEELRGIERMKLRPQLHAFLAAVKRNRLRMALSTRNCAHAAEKFIEVSNLCDSTFHPLLSRESLNGVNKPSPEVAHHIFRAWNLEPGYESTVWFVGDSADDMQCGKKAGCKTCLIRTPHNKDTPLATRKNDLVDLVVDSLEEFAEIINIAL